MTKKELSDQLLATIVDSNDKILFNESVNCYVNDCSRAAYILGWISIVASLKRKIFDLNNLGDNVANAAVAKIDKAEIAKQSTDLLIVDEAKKCGIIDEPQNTSLQFLWANRCLFAHPYNTKPTESQVENLLHEAVNITLAHPLNFTKPFIDQLCDDINNKPHFLPSDMKSIRAHAQKLFLRISQNLHPYFFKTALFKIGNIESDLGKRKEVKKFRGFLVQMLVTTRVPLSDPSFSLERRITDYPFTCILGFVHPETWNLIPDREQTMLFDYFERETDTDKLEALLVILKGTSNKFNSLLLTRYQTYLDSKSFNFSILYYGNHGMEFNRISSELDSPHYDDLNSVADFIRSDQGLAIIGSFTSDQQIILGKKLKRAADNNAFTCQNVVNSIKSGHLSIADNFKAGVAIGFFHNGRAYIRLPSKEAMEIMVNLLLLPQIDLDVAYDNLIKPINTITPASHEEFDLVSFDVISNAIKDTIKDAHHKDLFSQLIEAVVQCVRRKPA